MSFQSISLNALLVVAASAIITAVAVPNEESLTTSFNQTDNDLDPLTSSAAEGDVNENDYTNSTMINDEMQPPASYNWNAITIVTQTTGALSLFGSVWIIAEILSDRERRKLPYHRIMLGLSFFDICSSFCYFAAPLIRDPGDEGAACVAVGATLWTGALCIPLYNAALAVYFNLSIRYGWRDDRIARDFERFCHPAIIVFGLAFSIAAIPWDLYNPRFNVCYPLDSETNLLIANVYLWIYACGIVFASICVTTLMLKVYFYVNKILRNSRQVSLHANVQRDTHINTYQPAKEIIRTASSLEDWLPKVRTVALLYTLPFYFTWVTPLIWNTTLALSTAGVISWLPSTKTIYIMQIYVAASLPLQGFLNWIIYINLHGMTRNFLRRLCCHSGSVEMKSKSRSCSPGIPNHHEAHPREVEPIPPRMAEPSSSKEGISNPESSKEIPVVEEVGTRSTTANIQVEDVEAGGPCNVASDAINRQKAEIDSDLGPNQLTEAGTGEVDEAVMGTTINGEESDGGIEAMESGITPLSSINETREAVDGSNRQEVSTVDVDLFYSGPRQPTASSVQEALENALDLVRESTGEIQSIESGEVDTASLESERFRIIGIVTEALELTRSFVEESSQDGSNSSPWTPNIQNETRHPANNNPRMNLHDILSNYASNTGGGCQAPPPFITPQLPLFPGSGMTPVQPSGLIQILDEALEVLNSEVESISSNSRISDVRSVRSGSSALEAMLEGTLNAVNSLQPSQQSPSAPEHQYNAIPTTAQTSDYGVPTILDSVQRTEVSMLSSTIVAEEEEKDDEEGGHSEARGT